MLVGSWRAAGRHNAVLGRAHGMAGLLWSVTQWQTGQKNHDIFMGFRGIEQCQKSRLKFSQKTMF